MPAAGPDLSRFPRAFNADRRALEPFRRTRAAIAAQVAGRHYGDTGCPVELPVNLLRQYATIVARTLIPHNPRCLWTTPEADLVPVVDGVMQYVNEEAARQHLGAEAGKAVVDALLCMGVVQVALGTPADAASTGYAAKVGRPFAKRVSLDDLVFDTHARDFQSVSYIGHRIRPCLDAIRDDPAYSKTRKSLAPSNDDHHNADGDERLFRLVAGAESGGADSEFEERVDLWQVYFPRHRTVVLMTDDQARGGAFGPDSPPLMEKRWVGPECGPYHVLGMFWVTDLLLPLAPMPDLWPLHELVNNLYRKLMDQAERQKVLTVYDGAAAEDAQRIRNALDGDMIQVANMDRIRQMNYTGPDPGNVVFADSARQTFNTLAGNLELLGGTAPQAKTATQEKLLNANSSRSIEDMQVRVNSWMEGVFDAMGWFHHNHPEAVMETVKVPAGAPGSAFARRVYPHPRFSGADPAAALTRHFPYDRIIRRLDPYSMQYTSPAQKAGLLEQTLMTTLLPMMPLLQQQGVMFDANEFLSIVAKYRDTPEITRIVTTQEPPSREAAEAGGHGASHERTLAPQTTRTYERVNRSEATPDGQRRLMQAAAMGFNPGGNPAATGGQPTGAY